jgi:division protein CdvB (Snf7/Vps24/ESCRT-III family)
MNNLTLVKEPNALEMLSLRYERFQEIAKEIEECRIRIKALMEEEVKAIEDVEYFKGKVKKEMGKIIDKVFLELSEVLK